LLDDEYTATHTNYPQRAIDTRLMNQYGTNFKV